MAEELRTQCLTSINTNDEILVKYPALGQNWTKRFVKHHSKLGTVISQKIDLIRWKDPTPEVLHHWFDVFKAKSASITVENIYNMDETGFGIGTEECNRVIIDQSTLRTRYQTHPGRQEWVSVVECICADGTTISPLFIFKGEEISSNWVTDVLPSD